tara:strand:+ start:2419 stop:2931 length:513 start_codon:yes stop_codon:yes gene_type:complete
MRKNEIELKMEKLSDDKLIAILKDKSDYTLDEMKIAEKVLKKRGNDKIVYEIHEKQLSEEKEGYERVKAEFQTYNSDFISGKAENKDKDKKGELSENYEVLNTYKNLVSIFMLIYTAYIAYTLYQFYDNGVKASVFITFVLANLIIMFSLFCLTKMIDFLFDLDKHKSSK